MDEALVSCEYCHTQPMGASLLGPHQRRKHGISSTNPASVRRRIARDTERGIIRPTNVRPPPPEIPGVRTHRALRQRHMLDPGEMEQLRGWLLYLIQARYAPLLDAPPSIIIDAIRIHCDRNFEPPPHKRRSVPASDLPT